jgi:three-Cys-motif partner protein
MIDWELYEGREQSGVKHFFLQNYLERVAYNIGSFRTGFDYVDGFSGPWRSSGEDFQDTSFMIAINTLRRVRQGWKERGKELAIRCTFVEKESEPFSRLRQAMDQINDLEINLIHGEFESSIAEIGKHIDRTFAFIFIDPKGWTGFALDTISPLLRRRHGEVMINFMFNHINWFLEDERAGTVDSLNRLFGGEGWKEIFDRLTADGTSREDAILEIYCARLKKFSSFKYVTSARVLNPKKERSHFHLVYGTNHEKGLVEFGKVERALYDVLSGVRNNTRNRDLERDSGQISMDFPAETLPAPSVLKEQRARHLDKAGQLFQKILSRNTRYKYDSAVGELLELPLIWESDVKNLVKSAVNSGQIEIGGITDNQRVPHLGKEHYLIGIKRS